MGIKVSPTGILKGLEVLHFELFFNLNTPSHSQVLLDRLLKWQILNSVE